MWPYSRGEIIRDSTVWDFKMWPFVVVMAWVTALTRFFFFYKEMTYGRFAGPKKSDRITAGGRRDSTVFSCLFPREFIVLWVL